MFSPTVRMLFNRCSKPLCSAALSGVDRRYPEPPNPGGFCSDSTLSRVSSWEMLTSFSSLKSKGAPKLDPLMPWFARGFTTSLSASDGLPSGDCETPLLPDGAVASDDQTPLQPVASDDQTPLLPHGAVTSDDQLNDSTSPGLTTTVEKGSEKDKPKPKLEKVYLYCDASHPKDATVKCGYGVCAYDGSAKLIMKISGVHERFPDCFHQEMHALKRGTEALLEHFDPQELIIYSDSQACIDYLNNSELQKKAKKKPKIKGMIDRILDLTASRNPIFIRQSSSSSSSGQDKGSIHAKRIRHADKLSLKRKEPEDLELF